MGKDINTNPLSKKERRFLQWIVVGALLIFLLGYFLTTRGTKDYTVYFEQNNLHIFDEKATLRDFPDRVSIHYPYLLVIKPEETITDVYNLEKKEKKQTFKEVLLDYYKGIKISNRGKTTYWNNINLGALCSDAFIKSEEELLCTISNSQSRVVSINPKTKKTFEVYTSKNIVTKIALINNLLYIGEINPETGKSYLVVNGKSMLANSPINIIYPLNGKSYFASFKSHLNKDYGYFEINMDSVKRQETGKIVFY